MIRPSGRQLRFARHAETAPQRLSFRPRSKPEDVLQGVVKHCSFSQSVIFPGTVRDVTVFIPAQYDGSKPACVYVKTDGYNPGKRRFWKR